MKKSISIFLALILIVTAFSACSDKKLDIDKPSKISIDEENTFPDIEESRVEESPNVNGMRFNLTLYDFTSRYNSEKRLAGDTDLIIMGNWRENGDVTTDNNGVKIRYYYYDDYKVNITVTIEEETEKLVNVGCGTTMSYFMSQDDDENNSEKVIQKAALMALAACGYENNRIDTLQDIFYKLSTEADDSIYYDGFVFSLSTKEDKGNSKNSIMLFRVFPISDDLKSEWKLAEYGE